MKRHFLKSLRLTIITAAVALLSVGQPISFVFLKSSPNGTSVYAAEKESKDNSEIVNIAKKITVRIEGASSDATKAVFLGNQDEENKQWIRENCQEP